MRNRLVAACVGDFIAHADKLSESIDATVDAVIAVVERGNFIIFGTFPEAIGLKTTREGVFSFIPSFQPLSRLRVWPDEKLVMWYEKDKTIRQFD